MVRRLDPRRSLTVALIGAVLAAAPAQAQQATPPAALQGSIHDPRGRPISDVEIFLAALSKGTRTDSAGRFLLAGLPEGVYTVVARRVGYQPLRLTATLNAGDTATASFTMTEKPGELDTVHVVGSASARRYKIFADRKVHALGGKFFASEEIAAMESSAMSTLLATKVTRMAFVRKCGGVFLAEHSSLDPTRRGPRFGGCFLPFACYAQVYLDGAQIYNWDGGSRPQAPPNVDDYSLMTVGAIEVYASPAETPGELNSIGAPCGTIVIWSRTGPDS